MLLDCEHDRAIVHFPIGAANAPSGAMAAANKLNHEMNTRAEIIFMISSKKTFEDTEKRPSPVKKLSGVSAALSGEPEEG
jgi:hypothetical protein